MVSAKPTVADTHRLWPIIFIAPCLLGLVVFTYGPVLASFSLGFFRWNLLGSPHWVGLENYRHMVSDPVFWQTLGNTLLFVAGTTFWQMALGLLLALLLNQSLPGKTLFRAALFLPFITPLISVAVVWGWVFDPQHGLLKGWLFSPQTALWAIMIVSVWKTLGYTMVLFLAGLQAIPAQVYESAQMDGATPWETLWRITLPLLSPTLFFVLTVSLIQGFQVFDTVYLLTQGGPSNSTQLLVYWMYKNAFEFFKVGEASAIAYVLVLFVLVLTAIQWKVRKRWVLHEEG